MSTWLNYRFVPSEDDTAAHLKQTIGCNVRRFRMEQGMSKRDFATICGFSRPFLDKVENGTADIRISYLNLLADVLCVRPAELLEPSRDS